MRSRLHDLGRDEPYFLRLISSLHFIDHAFTTRLDKFKKFSDEQFELSFHRNRVLLNIIQEIDCLRKLPHSAIITMLYSFLLLK
jgi:hypothetical protein